MGVVMRFLPTTTQNNTVQESGPGPCICSHHPGWERSRRPVTVECETRAIMQRDLGGSSRGRRACTPLLREVPVAGPE
jgi:hypothetical protein